MNNLLIILSLGAGATAITDVWSILRKWLFGIAPPNYGLVGRWIAYMPRGRFRHDAIAATTPLRGELIIGWTAHYLIGVAFAALLIAIGGMEWVGQPTPGLAIAVGIGTVLAPFLIMQPGMGAGIAAARTARPGAARLQSLITHAVFGLGLYVTGWVVHFIAAM